MSIAFQPSLRGSTTPWSRSEALRSFDCQTCRVLQSKWPPYAGIHSRRYLYYPTTLIDSSLSNLTRTRIEKSPRGWCDICSSEESAETQALCPDAPIRAVCSLGRAIVQGGKLFARAHQGGSDRACSALLRFLLYRS